MDQLNTQTDYEFGGFRLDTRMQVLVSGAGEHIVLPARAYDALRYLVERAGELVEKRSLMHAVWPNTVVEENNLNQCILMLRKALGEAAGERRFILTVPGRGFKFVAPVHAVCAPAVPASGALELSGRRYRYERRAVAGAGLAAGVVLAAMALFSLRTAPTAAPASYEALTDLSDSATAPALSPDGRMLAFIGGGSSFLSYGQVYVKLLPDGVPVRLTDVPGPIYAPTFSADGTRVAYTFIQKRHDLLSWDTWTVPITGGAPTLLVGNAAGLTWIGAHQLMFSELRGGLHMGVVTSADDRAGARDLYFPSHERGMAHYSYLSPDRRSVLIVEMDRAGQWQRCRLVPFDGSSAGTPVGPVGACQAAAWSPDGKWMYFAADVGGHSHLWRQRYPRGQVHQITFGPSEEEGVAVAPDGRSLVTSLGQLRQAIWIHDATGARRLTKENVASAPRLSRDAQRLYFLAARSSGDPATLWCLDIRTGQQQPVLPGFAVARAGYDISPDEQEVAFTVDRNGGADIWIAALDRHAPPHILVRDADQPVFAGDRRLFFRSLGERANYLYRIEDNGRDAQRAWQTPILDFHSVSPTGRWAAVQNVVAGRGATSIVDLVEGAVRWSLEGYWPTRWSADGSRVYLEIGPKDGDSFTHGRTLPIPLVEDAPPEIPALPVRRDEGTIPHPTDGFFPGPDPDTYAFTTSERLRNIYRIPLR
ncbi:MAG TPA: winged helix-turn-helix domain-containing protein [Steroidobacteraceae bacterium]|nr:winged helix-turn-helix domain-containing protein [Steroidobacteraceae bacterium]